MTSIFMFFAIVFSASIIDHKTNRLPDNLTIPFLFLGLLCNVNSTFVPLYESALGSTIGYSLIRLLHGFQISRYGAAGIGLGDAKYLAGLCAWFGWRSLPFLLTASAAITLVFYPARTNKPLGVGLGISALVLFVFHGLQFRNW
ncbi:MAG: A24 family peptidase [Acidiferrobacterales bacterium]|nr:A24 family peptidase [Acidiferrobacterales bacterium]